MTKPDCDHTSEAAFEVKTISFAYREVSALKDLSLRIPRGERVALIGANGSGKSTLLRMLAGLSFPDCGEISFFGEPLTKTRLQEEDFFFRFRRRVGVLFQNPDFQLFNSSVFDEIAFAPLQLRWPRNQIREAVEQTLHTMGIADLRDRAPHRLSGGEKKRVALASILVLDPDVLLLDEPTAALDPISQNQIVELLASWANGVKTVITATHDLDSLADIADRCYVLKQGRLAGEETPLALMHNLPLLTESRLIRLQEHRHDRRSTTPHPHVHIGDL
ncbi:MAG TPA: ABC transporter ATP-binding protein [Bryobacteraceae bacterium]|jgi:cobalt/nickel transport system ATP-binding protein|nr:ABC transporter ATP-binding protein [Bryobacteraceae bacterium]